MGLPLKLALAPTAAAFALSSAIFFGSLFVLRWLAHALLRACARCGGRARGSGTCERMGAADAIWMQDTRDNLMVINAVIISDRVSVQAARAAVVRAWLGPDSPFGRLRRRPLRTVDGWVFEESPTFDAAQHVFALPADVSSAALLRAYIGRVISEPLPADLPAWQFQVAPCEDGGSATVFRIHHSYGDGLSLVRMLIERLCEGGAESYLAAASGGGVGAARWRGVVDALVHAPLIAASEALRMLPDRNSLHGQRVSGARAVAWGEVATLDAVKAVRAALHVTVNDVLVGCVAGAVRRVMRQDLVDAAAGRPGDAAGRAAAVAAAASAPLPNVRICSPVSTRSLRVGARGGAAS